MLVPVFLLSAAMLVVAGVGKLIHPRSTAQALYTAGIPADDAAGRSLGVVEIVIGMAALVRPVPWTALSVAVIYAAFAGFVTFLIVARPQAASCGCAGGGDAPPSWVHVVLDLFAAGAAVSAAVVGVPSLMSVVADLGWLVVPAVIGLATAGWLAAIAVAEVPEALGAWTAPTHHEERLMDPDRHRRADAALATSGIGPDHPSLWPGTDRVERGDGDVDR